MKTPNIRKIEINFIPKEEQRLSCYQKDGAADYYLECDGKCKNAWNKCECAKLVINVSKSSDWRPQWLVLLHEIVEITLVLFKGLSFEAIDRFDARSKREDPGRDPKAPYHQEHMTALFIEEYIAKKIKVKWGSY